MVERKKFTQSIKYDLLRIILLILCFSTVALSVVLALSQKKIHEDSLLIKGQGLAALLGKLSQEPLLLKDDIQLDAIVREAIKDEDVVYAVIHDSAGQPLTSPYAGIDFGSPRLRAVLPGLPRESELPDYIRALHKVEPIREISQPVAIGLETIGSVTVGMSGYRIRQMVTQTVLSVFLLSGVVLIVLGIALFYFTNKKILAPISGLAGAAARLAQGDLSTRVTVRAAGEMQLLIDSFNRMSADLEKSTVSRNYLDEIIASMRDTLIVTASDGTISRINLAAGQLLGYTEAELVGRPLALVLGEAPGVAQATLATILANGSVSSQELAYRAKNGRLIPISFSASLMRDSDGPVQGIVCVAQDITARRQVEEALRKNSTELLATNEELKNFANIISHDLRAPLVNIKGFSDELHYSVSELGGLLAGQREAFPAAARQRLTEVLEKEIPEAIAFIGSSVSRMDSLIGAILKLSRAGRRELCPEPVAVQPLVETIVASLTHQMGAGNAQVVATGLPEVVADKTALGQIFGNLLDNAVKYLEPGRPGLIEVWAEGLGGEVVFHVRDNGRGMTAEEIPRAFEIFRRLGRQDVAGEGMGLAHVKTLVRLLGGRIECASRPGQGTTFSFTLPRGGGGRQEMAQE